MDRIFGTMWIAAGRAEEFADPGRVHAPRRRRRERPDRRRRPTAGARLSQRLPPSRHAALRCRAGHVCRQHPVSLSRVDLRPDGRLLGAPQMDEVEGFRREDYPLRSVTCDMWDGHVFINLSEAAPPLRQQLGDLPARFAPWRMRSFVASVASTYDVHANWKLIVQNYNECLHCPVIHPLLNRMHHYLGAENVPSTETYCGGAMGFKDGVETLSTRRQAAASASSRAWRRTNSELVNYFAIYPNFLLTLHPDYMMTITIWPQDAGLTQLVAEWHFHPDGDREDRILCLRMPLTSGTGPIARTGPSRSGRTAGSARAVPARPVFEREKQLWEFDQFVIKKVGRL